MISIQIPESWNSLDEAIKYFRAVADQINEARSFPRLEGKAGFIFDANGQLTLEQLSQVTVHLEIY